jgi:hypothetical protein
MPLISSPISQRIEGYFDFDKRLFFFLIVLIYIAVRFITNDIILQAIPGYEQLEEDGTFMIFHIFNALNYLWTPFALIWKFTLTAFVLWIGGFAFGYRASFKKLWQYIMVIEVIFVVPEIMKMLYFMTLPDSVTYQEIRNFYPFSLLSIIGTDEVAKQYIYPLQAINLFEFIYIVLLIFIFHTVSKRGLGQSALVVLLSYLPIFLGWLAFYIAVFR